MAERWATFHISTLESSVEVYLWFPKVYFFENSRNLIAIELEWNAIRLRERESGNEILFNVSPAFTDEGDFFFIFMLSFHERSTSNCREIFPIILRNK